MSTAEVVAEARRFIKRRRLSRPWSLIAVGTAFLCLPVINYFGIAAQYQIPFELPALVLRAMPPILIVLWLAPLPIGAGLLLVKRWGWQSFLVYSLILIGYNLYVFVADSDRYNMAALITTTLGVAMVIFFVRKDMSAPYIKSYPRGWRYQRRRPVVTPVRVDGRDLATRDLSEAGFYVDWEGCTLAPNSAVNIELKLDSETLKLQGGLVRIDDHGAGVAFRGLTRAHRRSLKNFLRGR